MFRRYSVKFQVPTNYIHNQVLNVSQYLIFITTLLFSFTLHGVNSNLLVVLLQSSQILTGLGELSFLHTLTDVPVDEGTLGVHQIELVVETRPRLGNSRRVAQHADGSLDLGQVAAWDDGGWLVVDADLEPGGTPVDELDGPLGLDGGDGSVDVLGHDVTTVQHAAGHVLPVTWVALDHLVGWLEGCVGDLGNRQLLVVGLLGGDDRGVGGQREVDSWVGHQVGLELGQVDVEGAVEAEGGSDGTDNLANESVQVGVGWSLNVKVTTADVVDGLVVDHEGAVGMLQGGVGGQDGVVGFHNGGGNLRGRVDGELKFGFFAVVDRQTLHKQRGETGSGSATETVEDEESLETSALIGQLTDSVEDEVDDLLAHSVVAAGVVVGGVLLAGDQLFGVEQLAVRAGSDLI